VKQKLMPLTTEEIIKTIESSQSTIMFGNRGSSSENLIRSSTGHLGRLRQALEKYPPVYWEDYEYMDMHELLTEREITFIAEDKYATAVAKRIECAGLFMTVMDGIHMCVH
jgi:hypothetical protein